MSTISNVGSPVDTTAAYPAQTASKQTTESKDTSSNTADQGVIYEPGSQDSTTASTTKKTYKQDPQLIAKLQADADARTAQLRSIVEKLMSGQGDAYGKANDMWKFLASGDYTVDAATKAQAEKDIAEDGYWGVNQTSDRIVDFAKALTGGDPDKIDEMRSAFEKGFKAATNAWGKDLPSISSDTYDAVMSKFDEWKKESTTADQDTITN